MLLIMCIKNIFVLYSKFYIVFYTIWFNIYIYVRMNILIYLLKDNSNQLIGNNDIDNKQIFCILYIEQLYIIYYIEQ